MRVVAEQGAFSRFGPINVAEVPRAQIGKIYLGPILGPQNTNRDYTLRPN